MSDAGTLVEAPLSGAVPAGGISAWIRIPVPGTGNLAIELAPRNYSGSTSTLFIQDTAGKVLLRLDHGHNPRTGVVDFHWNQKGTFKQFGIENHAPAGRWGPALYRGARAFKYLGRTLVVFGAMTDVISIAVASNRLRRSTQVVSAWALAWLGARTAGALGAELGSVEPGAGTAVGGLVFGFIGGVAGYLAGETAGAAVYDWAEGTTFRPLTEIPFTGALANNGSPHRAGATGAW